MQNAKLSARIPCAGSVADSTGASSTLQSAHQRLCAALLVKLVRRLLQLQPLELATQLARCDTARHANLIRLRLLCSSDRQSPRLDTFDAVERKLLQAWMGHREVESCKAQIDGTTRMALETLIPRPAVRARRLINRHTAAAAMSRRSSRATVRGPARPALKQRLRTWQEAAHL